MYIFLEKGEMEYLIGFVISGIILFLVVVFYRRSNLRVDLQSLSVENKRLEVENEKQGRILKRLLKEQEEAELNIQKAEKDREVAQQRAAEAYENTERVLLSEQRRLAAELQHKKELNEIEFEQEKERKQNAMNLYFSKLNSDLNNDFLRRKDEIESELIQRTEELNDFRSISESINQAILRKKELEEKEDFYSIQVSENDREDIKVLQSMDLRLHNRDVIPKLIWELYIRRPAQEMIKRITAGRSISGIYKITYKNTKEAYIGKTTDISTRWQNHIKTAIGLEAAARSTLHTRMAKDGVWNYTFEILEEVPKDQLSMREAFYIDLYGTKQQLNMKEGSSK